MNNFSVTYWVSPCLPRVLLGAQAACICHFSADITHLPNAALSDMDESEVLLALIFNVVDAQISGEGSAEARSSKRLPHGCT